MTDRDKIDKLLDAGYRVLFVYSPPYGKQTLVEDAWAEYEREQSQYPKWASGGTSVVRLDGPN
jgi:hypothetical protein